MMSRNTLPEHHDLLSKIFHTELEFTSALLKWVLMNVGKMKISNPPKRYFQKSSAIWHRLFFVMSNSEGISFDMSTNVQTLHLSQAIFYLGNWTSFFKFSFFLYQEWRFENHFVAV